MPKFVREIMNREVLSFRASERAKDALADLVALGVSAAPVLDDDGAPIGVVSWRNLVHADSTPIAERMTSPAITIAEDASIATAAATLAEKGIHRLFVVDREDAIVGALSVVDVLRGLVGRPVSHPAAFPHLDRETGVSWSDDAPFDFDAASAAPIGPGVIAFVESAPGYADRMVHVEPCADVRQRLFSLLASPPSESPELAPWLAHPGRIHFRVASIDDAKTRETIARRVREGAMREERAEALR